MASSGGTDNPGIPTGLKDDFDELLNSGNFNEDNRRKYPPTDCVSWLDRRERQIFLWERDFREGQSELFETLNGIRAILSKLYNRMDRLCEGEDCYLALARGAPPDTVQRYFAEFIKSYDHLSRILRRYIAYANHYKIKFKKGEMPDEEPEDIQEKLFEELAALKVALRNLAQEVADHADESADSGEDTPDGPKSRSA